MDTSERFSVSACSLHRIGDASSAIVWPSALTAYVMAVLRGDIDNGALLVKYSFYVLIGILAGTVNTLVAVAVWRSPSLRRRKEYVVIGGLTLVDGLDGLATALAGLYRVVGISQGFAFNCVPVLACMVLPQTLIWHWAGVAAAFMLLALSADRLFAVIVPLKYYKSPVCYATRLVGFVYLVSLLHLVGAWVEPWMNRDKSLYGICDTAALSPVYYVYSKYATAAVSFSSVLVYGVVVHLLSRRMSRLCSIIDARTLTHQLRVQGRLSVTFGLSSVCTLFLDAVPRLFGLFLYNSVLSDPDVVVYGANLAPYFLLLKHFNAFANFLLLFSRHAEIRRNVKRVLLCQSRRPRVAMNNQCQSPSKCDNNLILILDGNGRNSPIIPCHPVNGHAELVL